MKYTTVFLDFDDTLIDTQGYAVKCLEQIYKDYNIEQYFPTFDAFIAEYLRHTHILWDSYALGKVDKETLLRDRFHRPFQLFSDVDKDYLDAMNEDLLKRVVKIDTAIDSAEDLLKYLKPKYKIVMLSNGFSELQYDKIRSVGFTDYFDEIILSDVVGVNKPHPDIFSFALDKTNSTASKSIMIGDNILADIQGAMKSNIDQIWYNPKAKTTDIEPTFTVSRLEQIIKIL